MTSPGIPAAEPVKVVIYASEVVCVYCGGAHLFEDCYANLVSINYVGNNKYNNTYSPGWRNHPNFSWSYNQNQLKPQAPHVSPGFSAPDYDVGKQGKNQLEKYLIPSFKRPKISFKLKEGP